MRSGCKFEKKHCLIGNHCLMRPSKAEIKCCLKKPSCRLEKKRFLIEKLEEKQYLIRPNYKANEELFLIKPGYILEEKMLPVWKALSDEV